MARFLRSRRERITPADVGLAPGVRRRTPGLRREEVAQLAGVGVTWYTWLEQGRQINASVQVLDAIARTLRLDQAEREHLYRLADVPSLPPQPASDVLSPAVQQVLDGLNLPAGIYNGKYDVLAWNETYARLMPAMVNTPPAERNVLWHLFTVPSCCATLANVEAELPRLVATFRAAFAAHVSEPAWTGFVRRLSEASPAFAAMWAAHEVAAPDTRVKVFQNLWGRTLHTVSTAFAVSATPEARMIVYAPCGPSDAELLAEVRSGRPVEPGCAYHREKARAGTGT